MADLFTDYQNSIENDNTFTDPSFPYDNSTAGESTPAPAVTVQGEAVITPTPIPEQENKEQKEPLTPAEGEAVTTPTPVPDTEDKESNTVYNTDDLYNLSKESQDKQDEYQTEVLQNQDHLTAQLNNLLSVSIVLLLAVGFLSGILLARTVWRKL